MSDWIEGFAEANPWPAALVAMVVGLAAIALLVVAAKAAMKAFRSRRYAQGRLTVAQMVATIGALGATGVGANTAWRFAGEHLQITNVYERAGLFLVGEVMLFGLALMARQNLHNPAMSRTGLPGTLVWVLSAFLAVPAISESDSFAGAAWRIVLGPMGAALLWHLAMGIELRQAGENDAENKGIGAKIARRFQQQLLSLLGIDEQDVTAEELMRERARSRAADLVDKLEALDAKKRKGRKGAKLRAQLRTALRKAGVAGSPERTDLLLADLAVSSHAPALLDLEHESPWIRHQQLATVPAVPALESGERRQLEQGHPLPAWIEPSEFPAQADLDEEWKRISEVVETTGADDEDGPDDDGPGGGAPLPEEQDVPEAVLNETVWAKQPEQQGPVLEPVHQEALAASASDAARVRYAMQHLNSSVTGEVVRWLRDYGFEVNRGSAHTVIGKEVEKQRRSNVTPLPRREV